MIPILIIGGVRVKLLLTTILTFSTVIPANGYAENDTIAYEALIGYGVGAGAAITSFAAVGGFKDGPDTARSKLAVALAYPAGSTLGVYLYGGSRFRDGDELGAFIVTAATTYGAFGLPYFLGGKIGKIVAFAVTPLVTTAMYNLAVPDPVFVPCGAQTYRPIINTALMF